MAVRKVVVARNFQSSRRHPKLVQVPSRTVFRNTLEMIQALMMRVQLLIFSVTALVIAIQCNCLQHYKSLVNIRLEQLFHCIDKVRIQGCLHTNHYLIDSYILVMLHKIRQVLECLAPIHGHTQSHLQWPVLLRRR